MEVILERDAGAVGVDDFLRQGGSDAVRVEELHAESVFDTGEE